ncbi:hypothetical protein MYSTI_07671 [Myxococcus stipitatus DSM 14675]|uniref:DUF2917 domain-containing protein n=2 Tax=Myxococcus stipitatus TaxID=83455 RepID=L7ULS3_MYXSD|nr:hypothetical protein MYSTI_07671 [Myxococcus stipitatus DSM 14675]
MQSMSALTRRGWLSTLWNQLRPEVPTDAETGAVALFQGALWSRHLDGSEGLSLTCTEGQLWLTFESDPRDYILEPGSTLRLAKPGLVVVQATRPSRMRLAKASHVA